MPEIDLDALARKASTVAPSKGIPDRFVDFCAYVSITLTPGQRVTCLIAYDGVEPKDLVGEEREIARKIFGDIETIPLKARAVFDAVCGGRAGKSYILIAARLVWGMYKRKLTSLAPGQRAVALVIAPSDKLRQEVVTYAVGMIREHPTLRNTLIIPKGKTKDDIVSSFAVRRPDGHLVDFEAGVATRGGYGGRGRSLTDFAMDESAFFRDASFQINDGDIFKAASPRVLPGGQSIVASTPWAEVGLLYELFHANWGKPSSAMVAHAPTLLLQNSEFTRDIVARERERDADNALREFDAKFVTGGTTRFFEEATLVSSIDPKLADSTLPQPGDIIAAGGDLGFRADSSALAIVHRRAGTFVLGELLELRPLKGVPLKPSETIEKFAERMLAHGATYLVADGHYREAVTEYLVDAGLAYSPAPGKPADAYMRARALLRQGVVRIPNNPRLLQQLKEIQGRPLPGGGMSIVSPRWKTGGHGDLVSALVLALHNLGSDEVPDTKVLAVGSAAWEEKERAARRKECEDKQEQSKAPWWRKRGRR